MRFSQQVPDTLPKGYTIFLAKHTQIKFTRKCPQCLIVRGTYSGVSSGMPGLGINSCSGAQQFVRAGTAFLAVTRLDVCREERLVPSESLTLTMRKSARSHLVIERTRALLSLVVTTSLIDTRACSPLPAGLEAPRHAPLHCLQGKGCFGPSPADNGVLHSSSVVRPYAAVHFLETDARVYCKG